MPLATADFLRGSPSTRNYSPYLYLMVMLYILWGG